MAFAYSNNGTSKLLEYRLESSEVVDQEALAMLANNQIEHVLSPRFSQIDEERTLVYDVTSLHPASEYFSGHVFNRSQWLEVLIGVTDGFMEAQDYMLDERAFAGTLDYLFVDEYLHPRLIYVPLVGFVGGAGARAFLLEVATRMAADHSVGDISYQASVQEALNQAEFDPSAFKKHLLFLTLKQGAATRPSEAFWNMQGAAAGGGQSFPQPGPIGAGSAGQGREMGGAVVPNAAQWQDQPGQPNAVPSSGGQPVFVNGMAVPPSANGVAAVGPEGVQAGPPDGDAPRKTGVFGMFKRKPKDQSAAHPDKGVDKKKKKKEKKQKGKSGGLFGSKKKSTDAPAPGLGFAVPGTDPLVAGQESVPGQLDPVPPTAGGQLGSVNPDNADYASGNQYGAVVGEYNSPDFAVPLNQAEPHSSVAGESYVSADFGLTEVYGIPNVAKRVEAQQVQSPAAPSSPELPAACLERVDSGEIHAIRTTPFRIGRRKNAVELHVPGNTGVSRVHAIISFDGSNYSIADNNSANHTYVNSRQLNAGEKQRLVDGDRLRVADEDYVFHLGAVSS